VHQAGAQVFLPVCNQPGHGRRRHVHGPGGSGQAPFVNDFLKHPHAHQSVHGALGWNFNAIIIAICAMLLLFFSSLYTYKEII